MKQNLAFLTVAIIFATLAIYFFIYGGLISNGISIFCLFGLFLTSCAWADTNNNSSNILDDFEIEKSHRYRVHCIRCKGDGWEINDYFPTYKEAEIFCEAKDFFHWRIEKETI